jgi:hypothetical protein
VFRFKDTSQRWGFIEQLFLQKSLKIQRVNQKLQNKEEYRQYNCQKKKKKKTNIELQNIVHRKLKIEQHKPHKKLGVNSGVLEQYPHNIHVTEILFKVVSCTHYTNPFEIYIFIKIANVN